MEDLNIPNISMPAMVGLAQPVPTDPTNKRIHLYLYHGGVVCYNAKLRTVNETMLKVLLNQCGTTSQEFFHSEFSYCFVTYSTHEEAKAAIEGINNETRLLEAIDRINLAEGAELSEATKSVFLGMKDSLFRRGLGGKIMFASWASKKVHRDREYRSFHRDDENSFVDDCPDGFEREEWDKYCDR